MTRVIITQSKLDDLANSISAKSGEQVPMTIDDMTDAVDSILVPSGTIEIVSNGTGIDVSQYASADVAVPSGTPTLESVSKSYTPTESVQTETVTYGSGYDGLSSVDVTVGAISSSYVGSGITRRDSSDLSASNATVSVPSGYYAANASKAVSSGSVTAPNSISGTGATVSTGTNTLTLSKTISVTPNLTSAGYISAATAGNSDVSLTASVNTRTSSDLTASGATVTAPAGYYASSATKSVASGTEGTPTATKSVSGHTATVTPSVTNSAGYITGGTKTGTAVTVSASELDSGTKSITENGTGISVVGYAAVDVNVSGGGGGSSVQMAATSTEPSSASSSISFEVGDIGQPTSFLVVASADISTGTPARVAAVVYDGESCHGQTITNTSNAQVSADTGFTWSYSNEVLTVTASNAQFQTIQYGCLVSYGGGAIDTKDVQVGSGATSIEFTGLEDEPLYWSCIFKSNFSTSSGYQRVICAQYFDGFTDGLSMDSGAKYSDSNYSASYSNGSLTISSSGTNAGGYFHQPGYYQLTYAYDATGNYQSKTVTPTESQQIVQADSGYDALKKVTVNAIPSQYIVPTGNIAITSNTTGSNTLDVSQYATATVNVPTGGGSVQYDTKTVTASDYPVSLQFSSMKGQPKFFVVRLNAQVSSSGSTTYYYIVDIVSDGTTTHGNCFRIGSTRRVDNITSGYSWSYSGTTLTITSSAASRSASPGAFYSGSYELMYAY